MKTLIVTIKGMITPEDYAPLAQVSEVTYIERTTVTQDELSNLCANYDYLMLNYDVVKKLDDTFYANPNIRKLKAISVDITGMEWANPHLARKYGVLLLNIPAYSTESVAESIVCEVLLHARKIHAAYEDRLHGREPEARKGINIQGRKVGIIGLGNIGTRVAEILGCLGANVVAWNRTRKDLPYQQLETIGKVFAESDIVCLCLKTIKEGSQPTVGIIDAGVLGMAKPGAILVNLASRHLVDHEALFAAISEGKISGYSVTRNEQTKALKIASLDCVSMPPANAWFSDESLSNLRKTWVNNVISAINGSPANIFTE